MARLSTESEHDPLESADYGSVNDMITVEELHIHSSARPRRRGRRRLISLCVRAGVAALAGVVAAVLFATSSDALAADSEEVGKDADAGSEPIPAAPGGDTAAAADTAPGADTGTGIEGVSGDRAWPVGPRPTVLRGWEPPASPYGPGHRGVDLAAAPGTVIRAAAPGRVSFTGMVAGRGVLSITLTGTGQPPLRTTYEPVTAVVAEGDEVTAGQIVAVLGPGPFHCEGGCLHWGLLRGETYLDPLSLLPDHLLDRARHDCCRCSGSLNRRPHTRRPDPGRPSCRTTWRSWPRRPPQPPETRCTPQPCSRQPRGCGSGAVRGSGTAYTVEHHGHRRLGDHHGVLGRAQLDPPHGGVHNALEQHRGQPRLLVAQFTEGFDDHRDESTVRRSDLLPSTRVQLTGGDGDHGAVAAIAHQAQLPADIRFDLALGGRRLRHREFDLGGPDGEVDSAELFDDGRARPEVLVDRRPGEARTFGEGGKGQRIRAAFGQEGACGVEQGAALHGPVLGHGGRSNPGHGPTLRRGPPAQAGQ